MLSRGGIEEDSWRLRLRATCGEPAGGMLSVGDIGEDAWRARLPARSAEPAFGMLRAFRQSGDFKPPKRSPSMNRIVFFLGGARVVKLEVGEVRRGMTQRSIAHAASPFLGRLIPASRNRPVEKDFHARNLLRSETE